MNANKREWRWIHHRFGSPCHGFAAFGSAVPTAIDSRAFASISGSKFPPTGSATTPEPVGCTEPGRGAPWFYLGYHGRRVGDPERCGTMRIVNSIAIMVLALLVASISRAAQETNTNYSGKATVARLGMIAFPVGEWSLEFQRIQAPTNSPHLPDYFVFKRLGERMERLTFLRYPPTVTPRRLGHMLDTIGETMGDGIPREEKKSEDHEAGVIHPMRLMPASPTATERQIEYSFIHVRPSPASSWLCHCILFFHDRLAIVVVHASTSVIDPEMVGDVKFRSQLNANTKAPRDDK